MTKAVVVKEPKLTIKQRRFLQEYFKTGNGVQSALKVYDTKDYATAGVIASQNLKKLKTSMKDLMEIRGLSVYQLIDTVKDAMTANRVISAINTDKKATGGTTDFIEVPDHTVRLKAVDIASKWLGVQDQEANQTNIQINFTRDEN